MRTDVGTWRDGVLVAKPKDPSMPDPLEPEWREVVYIRNNHGRVVPVAKWLAYDMIQNRQAELSTKEDYLKFEEKYWEEEKDRRLPHPQAISNKDWKRISSQKWEGEVPGFDKKEAEKPPINEVLEAVNNLNNKFDKLTDAILTLASHKKERSKK